MPRVTVLMSAYNAAPYILEAVDSVLRQTYTDFELLIIDDGSTDGTREILAGISDPRIRLVLQPWNQGLIASLNLGLDLAQGELIARMDADDICVPTRLEYQVALMDADPGLGVCGGQMIFMDNGYVTTKPLGHEELKCWLLLHCHVCHPTIMMRKSILDRWGFRYNPAYPHAEDFGLWQQLAHATRMINVPEVLLYYRRHRNQVSAAHYAQQTASADRVRVEQLYLLGVQPTMEEYALHMDLADYTVRVHEFGHYTAALAYAEKLLKANRRAQRYDQLTLNRVLSECFANSLLKRE